MDKIEPEKQQKEKAIASNPVLPACGEFFKPTAIHGAVMGNISGFQEGNLYYKNEHGQNVYILTQLLTYSRSVLRIYNVEMTLTTQKTSEKKTQDISLVLTHEFPLFGEIKAVNLIANPFEGDKKLIIVYLNNHRVCFIICYINFQLATLSLDPVTNTLVTVDLHNFENPDLGLRVIRIFHFCRAFKERATRIL
jgi:hypothetical protein